MNSLIEMMIHPNLIQFIHNTAAGNTVNKLMFNRFIHNHTVRSAQTSANDTVKSSPSDTSIDARYTRSSRLPPQILINTNQSTQQQINELIYETNLAFSKLNERQSDILYSATGYSIITLFGVTLLYVLYRIYRYILYRNELNIY